MHELGVTFHIMDSLEKIAAENEVTQITKVTLELGEVSAVIPSYLTKCWKWAAAKRPLFEEAELVIETLPAVTFCRSCERRYPTVAYGKKCPYCESEDTFLIEGNECNIKEIEVL